MEQIQVIARFQLKPGRLGEFERIAKVLVDRVEKNEPEALRYLWYANPERTRWVVIETYRDSAAVLAHVANLGGVIPELLAAADLSLEFFGPVSDALLEAVAGLQPGIYSYFGGVDRAAP